MKKTAFFLLLFMQFSVLAFAGGQKDKGLSSEALALDRQANDFFTREITKPSKRLIRV